MFFKPSSIEPCLASTVVTTQEVHLSVEMSDDSHFLAMPYELRNLVYLEVILLRSEPPQSHDQIMDDPGEKRPLTEIRSRNGPRIKLQPWTQDRLIWGKTPRYSPPMQEMVLVNHQIRDEAMKVLRKMEEQPAHWILDLAYLRDVRLCATWISIPVLTAHVDTLTIEFRALNSSEERIRRDQTQDMFGNESVGFSHVDKMFCDGLRRILTKGPAPIVEFDPWPYSVDMEFSPRAKKGQGMLTIEHRGLKIKNLVFDFLPCKEEGMLPLAPIVRESRSNSNDRHLASVQHIRSFTPLSSWAVRNDNNNNTQLPTPITSSSSEHENSGKSEYSGDYLRCQLEPDWRPTSLDEKAAAGETLCAYMSNLFKRVLKKTISERHWTVREYGEEYFRRVGNIEFRFDGKTRQRYDILKDFLMVDDGAKEWRNDENQMYLGVRADNEVDCDGPMMPFSLNEGE